MRKHNHPLASGGRHWAVWLFYAALVGWSTWPLAAQIDSHLPLGSSQFDTVPLFNVWTVWWNSDRLAHALTGYWNAPIFHPSTGAFAFSEPQPVSLLAAPVLWLSGSRILAYNVYLCWSIWMNGVVTRQVLLARGVRHEVATWGGAAMTLLPIVHWQLDVLQLTAIWALIWTWWALADMLRSPTVRRGWRLGLAYSAAILTCTHHGLFLSLLLLVATWPLLPAARYLRDSVHRKQLLKAILVFTGVSALLAGPVIWQLKRVANRYEFVRKPQTVAKLSAQPADYYRASGRYLIRWDRWLPRSRWNLSPGELKLALAVTGAFVGLRRRRWRRWTFFLLLTALASVLLSGGPRLSLGGWHPWSVIAAHVPGFAQVRNVFRFAYFYQIACVLLAAQAVHWMWIRQRICWRQYAMKRSDGGAVQAADRAWAVMVRATVLLIVGLALIETRPRSNRLVAAPQIAPHAEWIEFVESHSRADAAVVCLPFSNGSHVSHYRQTVHWMYYGTYHKRPMMNGYSGFFPRYYRELRTKIGERFPTGELLQRFAADDVQFLIVLAEEYSDERLDGFESAGFRLTRVYQDPVGIDVYELIAVD